MTNKPLLRVCPFCGEAPTYEEGDEHEKGHHYHTVECDNNDCFVQPQIVNDVNGIENWNKRL